MAPSRFYMHTARYITERYSVFTAMVNNVYDLCLVYARDNQTRVLAVSFHEGGYATFANVVCGTIAESFDGVHACLFSLTLAIKVSRKNASSSHQHRWQFNKREKYCD